MRITFYPFYFDPTMLILIPGLIIALWAQFRVKSTYAKYADVAARKGYTAAQAARALLDENGLTDVPINEIPGSLTDNYDPTKRELNLSQATYSSRSIAALGVAAHESGHAVQHATGYRALMLRNNIYPIVNIGSNLAMPLFIVGLIAAWEPLTTAGIVLFSLSVLFALVTLPVEFNASKRALASLENSAILASDEITGAQKVLSAAALTYVAAALMALLNLVRLLLIQQSRNRD